MSTYEIHDMLIYLGLSEREASHVTKTIETVEDYE